VLNYARPKPGELVDKVVVTVTFLHRLQPEGPEPPEAAPIGTALMRQQLSVSEYRSLYDEIGHPWLWWLRRVMPDELLAKHLAKPTLATYVLRRDGEVAGFFELEASGACEVNLNYFGLMPNMIGRGLGGWFLRAAIRETGRLRAPRKAGRLRLTVNTCSADHPRALPNYLAAGFTEIRRAREIWEIPRRLGFAIPDHLRV
jgi:GNAT superfamily N-acetyltransferase